jgi:2'-hydroxyisoflavone reductase
MKKVLIIGGTLFLGRVLVERLLKESNLSITLFNRGLTNGDLFPELEKIVGDRYNEADFKKITNSYYDCIIDTSCYFPDAMKKELMLLKGKVGRYIFISTISVYDVFNSKEIVSEDYKLLSCSPKQIKDQSTMRFGNLLKPIPNLYGRKKAECERLLLSCDWLDTIILRPGIIYGKYDFCDRIYYWLYRVKTQDKILLPDGGHYKQNNTFVEDLAEIIKQAIYIEKHHNTYNMITHDPVSLLNTLKSAENILDKKPVYVPAKFSFLKRNNISPYSEIPSLWDGCDILMNNEKIKRDFNCNFDSYEESIRKTIEYYEPLGWKEGSDGMSVAREIEVIKKLDSSYIRKIFGRLFSGKAVN